MVVIQWPDRPRLSHMALSLTAGREASPLMRSPSPDRIYNMGKKMPLSAPGLPDRPRGRMCINGTVTCSSLPANATH